MASLKCRRVLSPMGIVSNGYERRTTCLFFAIVCRQRDQCLLHSIIITSQPAGSMQGPSRNTPKQMPLINSVIYILHSIWLMETNLISKRLLLLETFSETLRLHIGGKKMLSFYLLLLSLFLWKEQGHISFKHMYRGEFSFFSR